MISYRKGFTAAIVDLLSVGIAFNCLDEAEHLLILFKTLRPNVREIEMFEAWILLKRGQWGDARRTLHGLSDARPDWCMSKAMLAYCKFAVGDSEWERTAQEVLDLEPSVEAAVLIKSMQRVGSKRNNSLEDEELESEPAAAADMVGLYGLHFPRV